MYYIKMVIIIQNMLPVYRLFHRIFMLLCRCWCIQYTSSVISCCVIFLELIINDLNSFIIDWYCDRITISIDCHISFSICIEMFLNW